MGSSIFQCYCNGCNVTFFDCRYPRNINCPICKRYDRIEVVDKVVYDS